MTTALLPIDIQNDYFPGGPVALSGMTDAATKAAGLLAAFREKSLPILHVRHLSLGDDAGFFVPGTEGSKINAAVTPEAGESVTEKNAPNSFMGTVLEAKLRDGGITDLVVVGAMSHMCIDATTRAAKNMGLACTVVRDACATLDMTFEGTVVPVAQAHAAFMGALGQAYATVVTARDAAGGL